MCVYLSFFLSPSCSNLVSSIDGEWFSLSLSLRQLSLAGNSVDVLPKRLFPAFTRLVWLDLSSNFIHTLSKDSLPPNLQVGEHGIPKKISGVPHYHEK